jgi:hypothetical protein
MLLSVVAPLAALGLTFALRRLRPTHATSALLVLTVSLGALWILDYVVIATDYKDADGFSDCWPACSTLQDLVALVFWYGGALLVLTILFSLGALAVALVRRRPGGNGHRRDRPAENEKGAPKPQDR